MKFKNLLFLIPLIFILGCEQYSSKSDKINFKPEKKYKNIGFALIYNDDLKIKKLDQRSLTIFHKSLKPKSHVKITNPINNKSLIAEIKSNRVNFSNFYNSIISERIADDLEINPLEPYVEIVLISKDSTFIANKAQTFDEEKKVAQKAPIEGIQISSLGNEKEKLKKKNSSKKLT
jgi:hypothetical protein